MNRASCVCARAQFDTHNTGSDDMVNHMDESVRKRTLFRDGVVHSVTTHSESHFPSKADMMTDEARKALNSEQQQYMEAGGGLEVRLAPPASTVAAQTRVCRRLHRSTRAARTRSR